VSPAIGELKRKEISMVRTSRYFKRATAAMASLVVAGGVMVGVMAVAPIAAKAAINAPSPDICDLGYVWRQTIDSDHVCVTYAVRSQVLYDNSQAASRVDPNGGPYGPNTCLQGYVWRWAYPGDEVCVTPDVRDQAAYDNSQAASRAIGNGITLTAYPIVFDNGVPVGGSSTLTLYGNGQYEFAGHFHDSGFTSYNTNMVFAVRAGDGTVFTFTDSGHVSGTWDVTFNGGSRDHDWDTAGYNYQLQADWANIQQLGNNPQWKASASLDLGSLFNDLKQAYGYISSVVSVVGQLLN
jgi:hypothetical protein